MILAGNQPYFMPYIGYFQLISLADIFLIGDDLQYIKGGWINRNRIIIDNKPNLYIVPISSLSSNKKINQLFVEKNLDKIKRIVATNYHNSSNYHTVFPLLEKILNYPDRRLNYFLLNSLQITCDYLGITTPLILNSERNDYTELRGEKRVIYLCKSMGADIYINASGGQALYRKENFEKEGITLKFIKPELKPYKQMRTQEFVPALSILDVMMNVPRDEIREMLTHYSLI